MLVSKIKPCTSKYGICGVGCQVDPVLGLRGSGAGYAWLSCFHTQRNCGWLRKTVLTYTGKFPAFGLDNKDNCGNSRANTCPMPGLKNRVELTVVVFDPMRFNPLGA